MLGSSAGEDLVTGKGFFPAIVSAQGSSHSLMSESDGVRCDRALILVASGSEQPDPQFEPHL